MEEASLVRLIDVTMDEDIYYNYTLNHYIKCPRSYGFPNLYTECWPSEEEVKQRKLNKLK